MKKIHYTLLIFLSSIIVNAQWSTIYQTTFPQIVKVMSSPNDSVCWFVSDSDTLFKTSDGGQTWTKIPPTTTSFNPACLFVLSSDTAFKSSNSTLYKTVNGGVTWNISFIGPSGNPPKAYMKNGQEGVLSSNGLIYRTTNGGNIWSFATITQPPSLIANSPDKGALYCVGDTIWVVLTGQGIAYSPDYGVTWNMPVNHGLTFNTYGNISFSNTQMGIAIEENSDTVYVTTDGAANWIVSIKTTDLHQDVLAVNSDLWFIPNPYDNYYIKYSGDSGATWTQQLFDQAGFVQLEKSRNGNTLWAGTTEGKVYVNTTQLATDARSNVPDELLLSIFPNPYTSFTTISMDKIVSGKIIISTVYGEVVKTINFSGSKCTIERNRMSSGIYIVRIIDGKGNAVIRKIIIQ